MEWELRNSQIFVVTLFGASLAEEELLLEAIDLSSHTRRTIRILERHARHGRASQYRDPVLHEYILLLSEHLRRLRARVDDMRGPMRDKNFDRLDDLIASTRSDAAELVHWSEERWRAQSRQRTGVTKSAYVAELYQTSAALIGEFADLKNFVELLALCRKDVALAGRVA